MNENERIIDWKVDEGKIYVLTNKHNFYVHLRAFNNGRWYHEWRQIKDLPFKEID